MVKAVAGLVWEVASFMWEPYQFLIIDGDTPAPWPTYAGVDAVYIAGLYPNPCPPIIRFMIIGDVVTIELLCITAHVAGLATGLCLLSLFVR